MSCNRHNLSMEHAPLLSFLMVTMTATCLATDDDSWDEQFIESLDSQRGASDPEEEEEELGPPPTKVRNLTEAVSYLEDVQTFWITRVTLQKLQSFHPPQTKLPFFTATIDEAISMTLSPLKLYIQSCTVRPVVVYHQGFIQDFKLGGSC